MKLLSLNVTLLLLTIFGLTSAIPVKVNVMELNAPMASPCIPNPIPGPCQTSTPTTTVTPEVTGTSTTVMEVTITTVSPSPPPEGPNLTWLWILLGISAIALLIGGLAFYRYRQSRM